MFFLNSSVTELRTAPQLPLPPYTFIPGQSPHPFRDPEGHNHTEKILQQVEQIAHQDDRLFLYGLELLNHHFFWETHEILEILWLKAEGEKRDLLQGLIKAAASLLKLHMNHIDAAQKLWSSAQALLEKKLIPGIDLPSFILKITEAHKKQSIHHLPPLFSELQ